MLAECNQVELEIYKNMVLANILVEYTECMTPHDTRAEAEENVGLDLTVAQCAYLHEEIGRHAAIYAERGGILLALARLCDSATAGLVANA